MSLARIEMSELHFLKVVHFGVYVRGKALAFYSASRVLLKKICNTYEEQKEGKRSREGRG